MAVRCVVDGGRRYPIFSVATFNLEQLRTLLPKMEEATEIVSKGCLLNVSFSFLQQMFSLIYLAKSKEIAIFLDYDESPLPIFYDPQKAYISSEVNKLS